MLESLEKVETPQKIKGPVNASQFKRLMSLVTKEPERVSENIPISGVYDLNERNFIIQYWEQTPQIVSSYDCLFTETGNLVHRIIQNALFKAGVIESDGDEFREKRVCCEENHITGYVDGIISPQRLKSFLNSENLPDWTERIHLEIKTCSDDKFSMWSSHQDLPNSYKCAASCYQKLLGLNLTCFLIVSRNSFNFKTVFYNGEEKYWDLAVKKARKIWHHVKNHTLPPPGIGESKIELDDPEKMEEFIQRMKSLNPNRKYRD